jgi:nitrous oxide reductase accessory protein NosL
MHPRRRRGALLAMAALTMLVAGCGSGSDQDTVTPQAPASQTGATVSTELTIVVDDGAGKTQTWSLTCDPPGGTHPNPAAACAALEAKGQTALPPVPKDAMCTQIYGGAQTAKITGSWHGESVNSTLSRTNGCEINRWDALKGLLPPNGGGAL